MKSVSRFVFALTAAAVAVPALAETWYWNPTVQEKRAGFGDLYWWIDSRNWTNSVGAAGYPALGDSVVMEGSKSTAGSVCAAFQYDSGNVAACSTNAVRSIRITGRTGLNQGNVTLQGGGEGLIYLATEGTANSLGIVLVGDGEVPFDIRNAGVTWTGQMRIETYPAGAKAVLVKKGLGRMVGYYQGIGYRYNVPVTKIQQGTFAPNSSLVDPTGKEFYFDGNDASQRLEIGYGTSQPCNFILKDGLLAEINGADGNHAHGITAATDHYLQLSGTPKVANTVFTGAFYDRAGLRWSPASSGYTFTISGSRSYSQGRLIVDAGAVRLTDGASFAALTGVEVVTGATLQIDEGCSVTCVGATLNGQTLAEGTYSAASTPGLSGGGSLTVSRVAADKNLFNAAFPTQLVLNVASGTKTLAEALVDYNAENGTDFTVDSLNGGALKDHALVKMGAGTLSMSTAIASYQGAVDVREGIILVSVKLGLGKSSNDTCPVYVRHGAQIYCTMVQGVNETRLGSRIVHIAGTGPDGEGALRAGSVQVAYGTTAIFGKEIILEDDATVSHWDWYCPATTLTLKGYTLTFRGWTGTGDRPVFFDTVSDNGRIKFFHSQARRGSVVFKSKDMSNAMEFGDRGGFRFWSNNASGDGLKTWQYVFTGPTSYVFGDRGTSIVRDTVNNNIWGPTFITNSVVQTSQNNTEFSAIFWKGKVSGSGILKTSTQTEPDYIHLLNPANDFSGGVEVTRGVLCAYDNGTLPDSGTVTVNRHPDYTYTKSKDMTWMPEFFGVALFGVNNCSLPPLTFKGNSTAPGRIQGGRGSWKKIVKEGSSTMEYFSEAGAPLLEMKAGVLKLPRGAAPGLWEGTNVYANVTAATAALAAGAAQTNLIVRGVTSAQQIGYQNPASLMDRKLISNTGYIWNRGNVDVTWTFASSLGGPSTLIIDGETVLNVTAWNRQCATKTLSPGAHTFEWRGVNATPWNTTDVWPAKFGFTIDKSGANSLADTNKFAIAVDPGDGSLFTRTAVATTALPVFEEMKFTSGATLDVNGNAYTAATVSGWPVVTSSAADASANPSFAITNKFVVNGADVAAGKTMTVQMPLSFGTTGGVLATNLATLAHGKYTIATTTADSAIAFDGAEALRTRLTTDHRKWFVAVSDDGKSIQLEYRDGCMLIFR